MAASVSACKSVLSTMYTIAWMILLATCAYADYPKEEVYSWAALEYDWPNDTMRQEYLSSRKFVVENNVITGIKVYHSEVFVTVPRWRTGVPSTLNKVVQKNGTPVLQPYPSWAMQEVGDCQVLQYVQSMEVDPHTGLMWIIDSGRVTSGDSTGKKCPLKLIVYDMNREREVRRFVFPRDVANPNTAFFNDIVLEYRDGCVAFAYITDSKEAKLYVYDVKRNEAYSFSDPTMQTEPPGRGTPIDGIAMSSDFGYVYYCPIEGKGLFQIPTSVLHDRNANFSQHVRRVGNRLDRSDGLAYGQNNLYYGLLQISGVQSWNVTKDAEGVDYGNVKMTSQEPVVRDDVRMIWPDTFAWDSDHCLWFTANDLSGFFSGRWDFTGANGPNMYVWRVCLGDESYLTHASPLSDWRQCFGDGIIG